MAYIPSNLSFEKLLELRKACDVFNTKITICPNNSAATPSIFTDKAILKNRNETKQLQ